MIGMPTDGVRWRSFAHPVKTDELLGGYFQAGLQPLNLTKPPVDPRFVHLSVGEDVQAG